MAQTRKILAYYQYSGSFSVNILVFESPGVPIYRVLINCYAIDIEDITSKFNPNVIWVFDTLVVPVYRVPPNSYAIFIEDIASKFNPNVF